MEYYPDLQTFYELCISAFDHTLTILNFITPTSNDENWYMSNGIGFLDVNDDDLVNLRPDVWVVIESVNYKELSKEFLYDLIDKQKQKFGNNYAFLKCIYND